jgi:tetratricopeptide (TPR) repeat protein
MHDSEIESSMFDKDLLQMIRKEHAQTMVIERSPFTMNASEGIELAATCIKRPRVLKDIKYQQLQDRPRDKQYSIGREVTIFEDSFLVLCLITIIGLSLLPNVFVLAKVEKDVASGNGTSVYTAKGIALDKLGNDTGAILYFDKALAIDPYYVNALTSKGLALDKLGNYTGAIQYFDKALSIQPNDTYLFDLTGIALNNLGNYTGAIQYFDRALSINPKDEGALTSKGVLLDNLSNHTGAIHYFDRALAIQPNDTYLLDMKGIALNNLGNYTGAIHYFDKALAKDPKDETALYNKGNSFHHLGFPSF